MFDAYPESDGYRAIVREVDTEARNYVERRLPFRVHFNELGDHTLYVALRGKRPLGLIYVRSEESEWGLTEIAWHLSLDLRVREFKFHRCRNRYRNALEQSLFAKKLTGLDYESVIALLTRTGRLGEVRRYVPRGAEELATTVVRSAAKALVVIHSVWNAELEKLQDLELGMSAFPHADSFERLVSENRVDASEASKTPKSKMVRSVRAVQARAEKRRLLGRVIETRLHLDSENLVVRWHLGPENEVVSILPVDDDISLSQREMLEQVVDRKLDRISGERTIERAAQELATILETLTTVGRH